MFLVREEANRERNHYLWVGFGNCFSRWASGIVITSAIQCNHELSLSFLSGVLVLNLWLFSNFASWDWRGYMTVLLWISCSYEIILTILIWDSIRLKYKNAPLLHSLSVWSDWNYWWWHWSGIEAIGAVDSDHEAVDSCHGTHICRQTRTLYNLWFSSHTLQGKNIYMSTGKVFLYLKTQVF